MSGNVVLERRLPILVTGAFGMLGSYFKGDRFYRTGKKDLDIRHLASIRALFEKRRFSLILHLAALTNLDYCEKHPMEAAETNVFGTENLARIARDYDVPLVYISTAGIFSGNPKEEYAEDDEPSPISVYARTKFAGENSVETLATRHLIVRLGWLMGGVELDHKFVGTLLRRLILLRGKKHRIEVVNDTRGSLLYAKDAAQAIWNLIRQTQDTNTDSLPSAQKHIAHLSNSGTCTRWDIAQAIAELLPQSLAEEKKTAYWKSIEWIPVSSAAYQKNAQIISRPKSEVLVSKYSSQKNTCASAFDLRPWREALKDYVDEWTRRN